MEFSIPLHYISELLCSIHKVSIEKVPIVVYLLLAHPVRSNPDDRSSYVVHCHVQLQG